MGLALASFLLSLGFLIGLPILFVLSYIVFHGTTASSVLADKTLIFLYVLGLIPAHVLTFVVVWAVVTRVGRFPFLATLGWSWSRNLGLWKSVGLALVLYLIGMFVAHLFRGPETDLDRIIESSKPTAYVVVFLAFVTAPLVEETLYRGVLYSALQRVVGVLPAGVLVVGLFTVPHIPQYWPNLGVISAILVLSVSLTLVRARTRRLLPCYVIHLIFNGIQSAQFVFAPYIRQLERSVEHSSAVAFIFFPSFLSAPLA